MTNVTKTMSYLEKKTGSFFSTVETVTNFLLLPLFFFNNAGSKKKKSLESESQALCHSATSPAIYKL